MNIIKNYFVDLIISPFWDLINNKIIKFDIIFFSFLIILLPIALITGPALPDIMISILGLYFLIISLKNKLWKYYKNFFVYFFLLFCAYSILRSLTSGLAIESFSNEGSLFYFRYLFFILGFWYLLDENPYLNRCFFIIILLCCFVVIIDGYYQYFVGVNFFGNEKFSHSRLTGLFGDEPIIGRYVSYMTIFSFILFYQIFKFNKKTTIISIIFLVISEIFIFFSGERAPLFYITFFSFLILIFIPEFRVYRIIGFFASIAVIALILQFNPTAKQRMIDATIEQVASTSTGVLPYSELHERHYVSALKMFKNNPIFGIGTNLFRYKCEEIAFQYKLGSCTSHPHHYYIQLLSELGFVGFMFLFLFFIIISLSIIKQFIFLIISNKKKIIPFNIFLPTLGLFVYLWPLIPHMSFYNNWNNIFLMMPIAYYLKFLSEKKI